MQLSTVILPITATSRRDLGERLVQLLFGLALYGFAIALMIRGGIGVAPWDVLTLGIASHIPLGPGVITVLTSVVVLLLWIPLRQRPGLGTLLNAVLVGVCLDLSLLFLPPAPNLWVGVPLYLAGLLVLALATAIYISADFGPGPRDGLMTGLVQTTGRPIWLVRTGIEGTVVLLGWLLGGPVGAGTLIFAFGVGPLIGLFLPRMERWRARRSAALGAMKDSADLQ